MRRCLKVGRTSCRVGVDVRKVLRRRYRAELGHDDFSIRVRRVDGGIQGYLVAERRLHRRHRCRGRVADSRGRTPASTRGREFYVYRIFGARGGSRARAVTRRTPPRPPSTRRKASCSVRGCHEWFDPRWGLTHRAGRSYSRCPRHRQRA